MRPRSAYAFGHIDLWARLASYAPGLVNLTTQLPFLRDIATTALEILTSFLIAVPLGAVLGLLIAERLLDEDKSGPTPAQMQSLNMLICTEGKERTLSEYTALLREAGFASVEARRTGTPLDAVLAIKPA